MDKGKETSMVVEIQIFSPLITKMYNHYIEELKSSNMP